jgi:hypothetical protein
MRLRNAIVQNAYVAETRKRCKRVQQKQRERKKKMGGNGKATRFLPVSDVLVPRRTCSCPGARTTCMRYCQHLLDTESREERQLVRSPSPCRQLCPLLLLSSRSHALSAAASFLAISASVLAASLSSSAFRNALFIACGSSRRSSFSSIANTIWFDSSSPSSSSSPLLFDNLGGDVALVDKGRIEHLVTCRPHEKGLFQR